jgi:nucleosome binding factor SPN SPT16 subunit
VPFHISTIKSVAKSEEGHKSFLRLNFHAPNAALGKDAAPSMAAAVAAHPEALFIRTLSFVSRDGRNLASVEAQIKAMQKKVRRRRRRGATRERDVDTRRMR